MRNIRLVRYVGCSWLICGLILSLMINGCNLKHFSKDSDSSNETKDSTYKLEVSVDKNQTVYQLLTEMGLSSIFVTKLTQVSKDKYDLSKVVVGTKLEVFSSKEFVDSYVQDFDQYFLSMKVHIDSVSYLNITAIRQQVDQEGVNNDSDTVRFEASLVSLPVTTELVSFSNEVKTSLWESASEVGMDSSLIVALADIFAWQLDFAREVRSSDTWKLVVEDKKVLGKHIGWGKILVAQYTNQNNTYTGVLYNARGSDSYYSPDGSSLKRLFLKSPVKYSRISSRFSKRRFHPILKVNRPHNGVDYAAPVGTPVMSVGDGIVSFAGAKGASGIMVKIKHNSTYSTAYLHLRNIARGVKKGSRVRQSQVIGYVGLTGSTSGPHCHFSFYENSRFVDPLGKKFPAQPGVPKSKMEDFSKHANSMLSLLNIVHVAKRAEKSANF